MARIFKLPFLLLLLAASIAASGTCLPGCVHAATAVVHPAPEGPSDVRHIDLVAILKKALEKSEPEHGPFTIAPAKVIMNESHQLLALEHGEHINVLWTSTSEEKEARFIPIRIPLRKGLLGYRICLIARDRQPEAGKVRTVEDLRKQTVGQGLGWGDIAVYKANGVEVVTSNYESLFTMTERGRFDLFRRGVGEVYKEYAAHSGANPELAVEEGLVIHYPWPYYFFFNKKDEALASRVEAGLRIMLRDGSFDAIFERYNAADIDRANLKNRRLIRLRNPLLPAATPLDDDSLWFTP